MALRWVIFELWPNFEKIAPNATILSCIILKEVYQLHVYDPKMTLTCSRSKVPMFISHMPPWPKFLSVCSTIIRFWGMALENKCTEWHWNDLDKGQKYPCAYYIHPWVQIFAHFALRWGVLELESNNVHQMAPNDVDMLRVKYLLHTITTSQCSNFCLFHSTMSSIQVMAQFLLVYYAVISKEYCRVL